MTQQNEQEIIRQFFGDRIGTFLDVGAFDGVTDSNTHALTERGWSGVLVEPCLETFIQLRNNKGERNICLHGACGRSESIERLTVSQTKQLCTLSKETPRLQHMAHLFEGSEMVQVWTVNQLQARFGDFNFISIDAEGFDLDVLGGSLNALLSAELVCVEKGLPGHREDEPAFANQTFKLKDFMRRIGWRVYAETDGNLFFCSPTIPDPVVATTLA